MCGYCEEVQIFMDFIGGAFRILYTPVCLYAAGASSAGEVQLLSLNFAHQKDAREECLNRY